MESLTGQSCIIAFCLRVRERKSYAQIHYIHFMFDHQTAEFFEFENGGLYASSHFSVHGLKLWSTPLQPVQRYNGTKEQKTNMKLMSKALGFCLWSCIGVISEEGPCPCTSLLSTPLPIPIPAGVRHEEGKGSSLGGMEGVVVGYVPREDRVRSHSGPVARWMRELWRKEAFLASWLSFLS